MYKNQRNRKVTPKSTGGVLLPVVMSQRRPVATPSKESGNNSEEIPSSQNENIQENLPSSQNEVSAQTQSRFLSQRHQPTRLTQDQLIRGKNYFEIALISCKINITDLGCEFMIEGDDPISFIRRFRSFISSTQQNNNENARKFLDGFNKAFSLKEDAIKDSQKFLSGCIMREAQKTYHSQTSLIQCFFAVPALKDEVAKSLLENLKSYVIERDEYADAFIVGLVVAQFKFSDQLLASSTYNIVYEQFFEILEQLKNDDCRQVVIANFRDLDEFRHDDAVKRLLTMYKDNHELLTPFIETFTEMCINDDTKAQISSLVQYLLQNNCQPKLYPGIVKSLFYYMQSPEEIVKNLRNDLKWSTDRTLAWKELKMKVILLLEKSVRREKSKMSEAWIKAITSLEDPKGLKPIDFIMLLAIVEVKEEKFPAIKKIFVQKVPSGFFGSDFLKEVFKTFPDNIAHYSDTLLELLNALQKNNIYEINEFNSTCFRELFAIDLSNKKEIIGSLVQFLCEKTPDMPFSPRSNFKMMTLTILNDMRKTSQSSAVALLVNHKILLRVLDISKVKLSFNEYRLMLELLCLLAYATNYTDNYSAIERKRLQEEQAVLQEHLHMTTNKLTYNPDYKIKLLGIIGGIRVVSSQVIDIIASSDLVHVNVTKSNDLPKGPIQDAANKIEGILECVRGNPLGFAFVCDELFLEFQSKGREFVVNELFLKWLSDFMFKKLDILTAVHIEKELPEVDGVELVHRYQAKSEDLPQPVHAVNLGLLVFDQKNAEVIAVAALFKVMRMLTQLLEGSLDSIYYFSVMPITVTDTFGLPEDELSQSDDGLSKQQLDLYFHCINWLRELIGTYCHWTDENKEALQKIVVQRVKQLVQIEKKLNQLLKGAPSSYYPPLTTFQDSELKKKAFDAMRKEKKATKVAKKPPKKTRKKNDATVAVDTTVQSVAEPFSAMNKIRQFCREVDSQVILLLAQTFNYRSENVPEHEFGLYEQLFLLDDVFNKVKTACSSRSAEQQGFYNPIQSISDLKDSVFKYLVQIFDKTCDEFVEMSQQADDDDSNDVFYTNDANLLKNSFCIVLQILDVVFSCPQLKLEKNNELLRETLKLMINEADLTDFINSQDDACSLIINRGYEFERNVKNCEGAVALVKLLTTISKFSSIEVQRDVVLELCEKFLTKEWKDSNGKEEQGAAFHANLEKLLEMYVETADLNLISKYVERMSTDFKRIISKELKCQSTFPSFTRSNSSFMMKAYLTRVSQILTTTHPEKMNAAFWKKCGELFNSLTDVVKCIGSQNAYIVYLKHFIIFMRAFNDNGIKSLKAIVKKKEKFLELVKSVQTITRFAHGLSCELRHLKNKSVVFIIPKLRELLMKHFQAVSCLLPLANIPPSEIQTGTLKNYGVDLQDIASQNTNDSAEMSFDDNNDDDEAMPSDDDTVGDIGMEQLDVSAEIESPPHASFRSRSTIL